MTPLDVVSACAPAERNATLQSHQVNLGLYLYLFAEQTPILRPCHSSVAQRQAGSTRPASRQNNEWRNRCPRASRHSSRLAWWPWLPHAVKAPQLKNTLWSTQSRSLLSQPTPANTSKALCLTGSKTGGQALRPVRISHGAAPLQTNEGGVAC